ncbi:MAG TPA: DivIVA domain-containing protein [Flexivirga sp.]|uniref:DivIVA domain-containing protein n=1 Tax=Flexivirga sp. TaxID=1962927 RepID=UPI002CDD4F1E|nr:DivIVA domain-containing protein [Flexivirga sp.]HWC23162.1 DivIVA domain-containing protein [Flexivirga sp.]
MADVQRQLDRVVSLMRAQQPVPPIGTVGLRNARFREGYSPESVTALFDNIAEWQRQLNIQHEIHEVESGEAAATPESDRLKWSRQQQVWVREITFHSTRFGPAYETDQVDDFLDNVLRAMGNGERLPDIKSAQFHMARAGRGGYDAAAVDHFLDQLERIRPLS